jgi:hypothetical protein
MTGRTGQAATTGAFQSHIIVPTSFHKRGSLIDSNAMCAAIWLDKINRWHWALFYLLNRQISGGC